jgi:hypothetical protein
MNASNSCSFVRPLNANDVQDVSDGTQPTKWNANCGASFGHELMFSRTLELGMGVKSRFEMVKNAEGGTEIHKHWYVQLPIICFAMPYPPY